MTPSAEHPRCEPESGMHRVRARARGGCQLQHGDSPEQFLGGLRMGVRQLPCVQPGPELILDQPAGHQSLLPEGGGRAAVLREELSQCHGRVDIDQRSSLSACNSASSSCNGATGSGLGGIESGDETGGVSHPLRTASASIGLLVSLGGPISATTRSRSVIRTVSPDAASRTYSLTGCSAPLFRPIA